MAYSVRGAGASPTVKADLLPMADVVPECPPHFWILKEGWQQCKKCRLSKEIVRPDGIGIWSPRKTKQYVDQNTKES